MRKLTYEEESFDEIHRKNMRVKDMIERLQKYPEDYVLCDNDFKWVAFLACYNEENFDYNHGPIERILMEKWENAKKDGISMFEFTGANNKYNE